MKNMKKVIVIGSPGSGKTTFAEKLRDKTGLQLFHLDAIWHRADKTHISREEFDIRLGEILSLDSYIIDGNYSRTVERRISACDTIFFFDLPTETKKDKKAFVDATLCVGCGVCQQLCAFDAIGGNE